MALEAKAKVAMGCVAVVLLSTALALNQRLASDAREQARLDGLQKLRIAAVEIDRQLAEVASIHRELVGKLEGGAWSPRQLEALLCESRARSSWLLSVGVAFRPWQFSREEALYSLYCQVDSLGRGAVIDSVGYDYTGFDPQQNSDWYHLPLLRDMDLWLEPHFEPALDSWVVVRAGPFENGALPGEVAGVVFSKFSLAGIQQVLLGIELWGAGYVAVASADGRFIAHTDEALVGESLRTFDPTQDAHLMTDVSSDLTPSVLDPIDGSTGEESWVAYAAIEDTSWTLLLWLIEGEGDHLEVGKASPSVADRRNGKGRFPL